MFSLGYTLSFVRIGRGLSARGRSLNDHSHHGEELMGVLCCVLARKLGAVMLLPESLEVVNGVWGKKAHAPTLPNSTSSYEQRCTRADMSLLQRHSDRIVFICQPLAKTRRSSRTKLVFSKIVWLLFSVNLKQ